MARTPVNKRQYGTDAVGAPLSFNQLDSNFAYFENMVSGSAGYIPVIVGGTTPRPVPGFPSLEYEAGKAQAPSVIKQIGGSGISATGMPLLETSASLQVFGNLQATGSVQALGGVFSTTVSASAITASGVSIAQLAATGITGSITGSIVGSLSGSVTGTFFGSASGYFAGQVDGTSSFTTAPIQTILNNGNIATGSFTLVGGTMRIGTATTTTNLVVDGTSSFNGYITTENAKIGNNTTDVHYVSGGLTIHAPYVNGTYPAGVNINTGTNLSAGGKVAIGGDLAVSSSMALVGSASFGNTLSVLRDAAFSASISLVGSASFGNTLSVNGNTILSSSLWVASNQIVTGALQVTGAVGFASTLDVKNNTSITGSITNTVNSYVGANSFVTGTLQVTGAVGFASTVDIKNAVTLTGSLTNTGLVALGSTLTVQGASSLSSSLTVGGATQINNTLGITGIHTSTNSTDSTATSNGSIVTSGGIGIAKAAWIGGLANIAGALTVGGATQLNSTLGATGVVTLTNATEATSTSTGAVILSGGLGMAKNLWVGGTLNVAGAVTLGTITGTLANALSVDNSSLEYTAGTTYDNSSARTIRVKALGIVNSMIANATIANAKLVNSTISSIALGSDLATLTRGSYLTGADYNGSTARTWAVDATTAATADKIVARDASGNINAAGFFQTSKRSTKTGIVDFDKDALDIIKRTKIVEFFYLTDLGNKRVGFIADDTDPILSTKNQDQMDTNSTVAVLIKAVQQLEARVIELEKQLESK